MNGSQLIVTSDGALEAVRRDDLPVCRVGYRPEPWAWTPWEYAGADGRFHGRWDDPHGTWRALYVGSSALACYLEVLAVFRPDPQLETDMADIADNDGAGQTDPSAPPGALPRSWCETRLLATGRLTGVFVQPSQPESLSTLRRRLVPLAKALGLADLDASAIRDSRPRSLTQAVSSWIYTLSATDDTPVTGIEFRSRHGDSLLLWAVYERDPAASAPPEIMAVTADSVDPGDPALTEAMRLHGLQWSD